MICNLCGTQEASIHLTEIVNNQMIEIHLCEACAQEKGTDFKTHFNLTDLLAGIADTGGKSAKPAEKRLAGRCPECGMTYDEFGKSGRLGCAVCYDSFGKLLLPLIKRVQRSTRHVGKRPSRGIMETGQNLALQTLHERLSKSVQIEEFEEAARLRDEIRRFEEKLKEEKMKKESKGKA